MKPRIFIGSSVEGLEIARALRGNLEHDAEVAVWDQDVFRPSKFILESLTDKLELTDFGIFVFSADDVVLMRGAEHKSVRDNVLFELGLWIGRLGRKRCVFVTERGADLRLPSDLLGINYLTYNRDRSDGNVRSALASAADEVRVMLKSIAANDYGIKITSPKDGDEVPLNFIVSGTYTKHPPLELISAIVLNERSNTYTPKKWIVFDIPTNTWQVSISIPKPTISTNNTRTIIIAAIGEHAKSLFDYRKKVGKKHEHWVSLDYNHTIKEDIQRIAQLKISLKLR